MILRWAMLSMKFLFVKFWKELKYYFEDIPYPVEDSTSILLFLFWFSSSDYQGFPMISEKNLIVFFTVSWSSFLFFLVLTAHIIVLQKMQLFNIRFNKTYKGRSQKQTDMGKTFVEKHVFKTPERSFDINRKRMVLQCIFGARISLKILIHMT